MTLHDKQYYKAIESKLNDAGLDGRAFIQGKRTDAISGKTFSSYNPATGDTLANIACCEEDDLNVAVTKARQQFEKGTWSQSTAEHRKAILYRWADLIEAYTQTLAVMESMDSGKPIADIIQGDLTDTILTIRWYAEAIDKYYNQMSPAHTGDMGMIVREPVGVVGAVLPWNFPLWMMVWKVAPALAAGNSLIVKPAEDTSLTALAIADLAQEAGLPNGVLNVLPGHGEVLGKAIGLHPDIDVVSFTGSTAVGRHFLNYAASSNLKNIILECGGKSPSVVLSDADDLDHIATEVTNAFLWNMGQNCTANARLIVHEKHKEKLLDKIIAQAKTWTLGDPLDPTTRLGPLISAKQFDQVTRYISQADKEGAKLVLGETRWSTEQGRLVHPTIFDQVTPEMTIAREEIFGPVLAVMTVKSDEEALKLANDTPYGLQASVYSQNITSALHAARTIKAGAVSINCYGEGDITMPFGGYKLSGFGGKDKSLQALDQYTETKSIWVKLS